MLSRIESREIYCAVVFTHESRNGTGGFGVAEYETVVPIVVDGNHGGAKPPPAYRWSNQIFRPFVMADPSRALF